MAKIKQKPMFSLKTYLLKKAEKKLAKLEHRAEKRKMKAEKQENHDHHDHDHTHEHAEDSDVMLEIEESNE